MREFHEVFIYVERWVGSYYSGLFGLGVWRTTVKSERVCNMAFGKTWIWEVSLRAH